MFGEKEKNKDAIWIVGSRSNGREAAVTAAIAGVGRTTTAASVPVGAAAPVVEEGNRVVGEGRRVAARRMASSAAVYGDGTERGGGGSGEMCGGGGGSRCGVRERRGHGASAF